MPVVGSMPPTPLARSHANVGCGTMVRPNWSYPTAANDRVPFRFTPVAPGVTATVVSVWATVTPTDDVTVPPWPSPMVTVNV
jgi:hypothetical protein